MIAANFVLHHAIFVLHHAICIHLTPSNDQRRILGMIISLCSKCMTSGYHHNRMLTRFQDRGFYICRLCVIMANCTRICDRDTCYSCVKHSLNMHAQVHSQQQFIKWILAKRLNEPYYTHCLVIFVWFYYVPSTIFQL